MNSFMQRAIELALQNVKEGGQPFGAVLVKDGEIISEGANELHLIPDISGHAELLAIRRAGEKLQTMEMAGFSMYASGYPCPMCLTAMYFTGITDIYYCNTLEEAGAVGLGFSSIIYKDLAKPNSERQIVMKHLSLSEELDNPMDLWQETN